jgi:hypothetical protein
MTENKTENRRRAKKFYWLSMTQIEVLLQFSDTLTLIDVWHTAINVRVRARVSLNCSSTQIDYNESYFFGLLRFSVLFSAIYYYPSVSLIVYWYERVHCFTNRRTKERAIIEVYIFSPSAHASKFQFYYS